MATPIGCLFTLPLSWFDTVAAEAAQESSREDEGGDAAVADRTTVVLVEAAKNEGDASTAAPAHDEADGDGKRYGQGATCVACGIGVGGTAGFASLDEQRAHARSDWHRYNVLRRAQRQPRVSEEEFAALVEKGADEVASISGSEDSSAAGDGEDGDGGQRGPLLLLTRPQPLDAALAAAGAGGSGKQGATSGKSGPAAPAAGGASGAAGGGSSSSGGGGGSGGPGAAAPAGGGGGEVQLAVWQGVLPRPAAGAARRADALSQLRALRQEGCRWLVLLSSGGHFAAAVMDLKPGARAAQDVMAVVAHKTFHRYVVRAKAGGRQSSKDAGGKSIKSAGSSLRRYNEAALERDIRDQLSEWAPLLASASALFVHAPAVNGRAVFAGADAPLRLSDERVRRVPFVVRRPTFSEVKRVAQRLMQVYAVPFVPPQQQAPAPQAKEQQQAAAQRAASKQQQERAAASAGAAAAAAPVAGGSGNGGGGLQSHPITVAEDKEKGPLSKSKKKRLRQAAKKGRHGGGRAGAAGDSSDDGSDGSDGEAGGGGGAASGSGKQQQQQQGGKGKQGGGGKQQQQQQQDEPGIDEIDAALAQIAAMNVKAKAKASKAAAPPKPKPDEAAKRRELAAAAAERRLAAIQSAAKQQQLW